MGPEFKPDKTHVVIWQWDDSTSLFADCDPDYPDAWRAPRSSIFRQTAGKIGPSGWKIIAAVEKQTWLVTEHAILSEEGEMTWFVGHRTSRLAGGGAAGRSGLSGALTRRHGCGDSSPPACVSSPTGRWLQLQNSAAPSR